MSEQPLKTPLKVPELIQAVISHVDEPVDLVTCACLNKVWNIEALRKLYKGSLNDMKLRTPGIGSLNSLYVSSPARFATAMSFVDHLMIHPERPVQDYVPENLDWVVRTTTHIRRMICSEKLRALSNRNRAEALLRPRGHSPRSIAIPFPMVDTDLSHVSSLIFHPHLKCLTIDEAHCDLLLSELESVQKLSGPCLLDLKALTIYHSNRFVNFDAVFDALRLLDLELFHLREASSTHIKNPPSTLKVMRHLKNHHSLKGLALISNRLEEKAMPDMLTAQRFSFPHLRALYLLQAWPSLLKLFSSSKQLRILVVRKWVLSPDDNRFQKWHLLTEITSMIAEFPNLNVIDITVNYRARGLEVIRSGPILLEMANSCPWLVKLKIETPEFCDRDEVLEKDFSVLLKYLPNIQWLGFDFKIRWTGYQLRNIADHCPCLTFLELERGQLFLSSSSLADARPLPQLQHVQLKQVWIESPEIFDDDDALESFAMEWSRVFPRLAELPCPNDFAHMTGEPIEENAGGMFDQYPNIAALPEIEIWGQTPVTTYSTCYPGPASSDPKSEWYQLRLRLWRFLGYGRDAGAFDKAAHMWQSNFEITTLGWPIMPVQAFSDPLRYSSSSKPVSRKRNLKAILPDHLLDYTFN